MKSIPFTRTLTSCAVSILLLPATSWAQSDNNTLNEVKVISTSPLEGIGLSIDKVPANVQVVNGKQIEEQGSLTIADYLYKNLQGVNVVETQGNPYQPDVSFHGFNASPLLGAPQGMSVYVDGVRVNEPFGDVVSWDLIPMNSVSQMQLVPGTNPVFGLNTLGGAISIKTKRGREHKGGEFENSFGSWGRKTTEFEYGGMNEKGMDYFFAVTNFNEKGWRVASPTSVNQYFGQLGWQDSKTDVNFTISVADNTMTGNGLVPSKMMEVLGRNTVYTKPDETKNQMAFFNLNVQHQLSDDSLLNGNAYYRFVNSKTLNGDLNDDVLEQGSDAAIANFITACRNGGVAGGAGTTGLTLTTLTVVKQTPQPTFTSSGKTYSKGFTSVTGTAASVDANGTGTDHWADEDDGETITGVANGKSRTSSGYDVGVTPTDLCNAAINTSNTKKNGLGGTLQWTTTSQIADKENQFTTGVSYAFSKIKFNQDQQYGYLNSERGVVAVPYYGDSTKLEGTTNSISLFAANTLSVSERVSITTSARFDNTSVSNVDKLVASGTGSLTGDHTFQRLNPSVGLNFSPASNITTFIAYNEGSRAPTSMELGCADPASPCKLPNSMAGDPPLKQVVTKSVDLGVRGVLGNGIGWSASTYRAINHDDIQFLYDNVATKGYFSNIGKTRRQGLDLAVFGASDKYNWSASASSVSATYLDGFQANVGNNPDKTAVAAGDHLPGIPGVQIKLRGSYQITPAWRLGGNVIYMGYSVLQGNENNGYYPTGSATSYFGTGRSDPYKVLHLDSNYKVEGTGWQILGKINNLLNTKFNTGGLQGSSMFTAATGKYEGDDNRDSLFAPGAPRAIWVGAKYEFSKK